MAVPTPHFHRLGYVISQITEAFNGEAPRRFGNLRSRRERIIAAGATQTLGELFWVYTLQLLNIIVESLDFVASVLNVIGFDFADWGRLERGRCRRRRRTRA
jgi:hypothetical protein